MVRGLLIGLALLCVAGGTKTWAAEEALDEVNALRARHGLAPFAYDEDLTRAAKGCADFRAERLMTGHCNDFAALPSGASADAAGCAAWHPEMGWGSCCTLENHRYAGAAYSYGRDGRRYMHIFVSHRPNRVFQQDIEQVVDIQQPQELIPPPKGIQQPQNIQPGSQQNIQPGSHHPHHTGCCPQVTYTYCRQVTYCCERERRCFRERRCCREPRCHRERRCFGGGRRCCR